MKLDASDITELKPVITAVVDQILAKRQDNENRVPAERLAYSEREAAELLGLQRHQLRDMRVRREIAAKKCGREWRYSRQTLLDFLNP